MAVLGKNIFSLVLLCALTAPSVTHAEFWDGYRLKKYADADDRVEIGKEQPADDLKSGYLGGFIVGVHDAVEWVLICAPIQVKAGQLTGIVKKYIRENPDKWNRPASTLVVNALSAAFPCKR